MATVLTTGGEVWAVDRFQGLGATASFIHWGTSSASAAKGDSTLNASASEARVLGVASEPTADKIRWVATLTANGAKDIGEAGNFDALTGGTLVVHGNFTSITLALNDTIQFTIDLEVT